LQVAKIILGPFFPPPLSVDRIPSNFSEAPIKLEGKLFAPTLSEYGAQSDPRQRPLESPRLLSENYAHRASVKPLLYMGENRHPTLMAPLPIGERRVSSPKTSSIKESLDNSVNSRRGSGPPVILNVGNGKESGAFLRVGSIYDKLPSDKLLMDDKKTNNLMYNKGPSTIALPRRGSAMKILTAADIPMSSPFKLTGPASVQDPKATPILTRNYGFWETIRRHPTGRKINKVLDTTIWVSINILASFIGLFADDFVKSLFPKQV